MADQFVSSSEVAKLVVDSYEALHTRLAEAIQSNRARIFGHVDQAILLGTFPNKAVVVSSDGRFADVKWEAASNGELKILESAPLSVPTYTKDTIDVFVQGQAQSAAQVFLSGDKTALTNKLSEMATLVGEKPRISEEAIALRLISTIQEERPWKKTLHEKRLEIKSAIFDHISPLESARLSKKFERLYNGSTSSEKLEHFRDLIAEDFRYLSERLIALTDLVAISLEGVEQVKTLQPKTESRQSTFESFRDFSEGLLSNLTELCRIVVESQDQIKPIGSLSKIYDAVAEELFNYEVAGRYVERMASRICANKA